MLKLNLNINCGSRIKQVCRLENGDWLRLRALESGILGELKILYIFSAPKKSQILISGVRSFSAMQNAISKT